MAWIIGKVSDGELERLRKAGWEDCDPPEEMLDEEELRGIGEHRTRAFFVDSDLFTIMTGPDWEKCPLPTENEGEETQRCNHCMSVFDESLASCPVCGKDDALMYPHKQAGPDEDRGEEST